MSKVFVIDTQKRPLDPVHPGWARKLLSTGHAAVWRRYPFTIICKKAVSDRVTQPLRLKLDPGSQTTGMAIVNDTSGEVVFAAELTHRGQHIKKALDDRRALRRSRRQRKTRYRKPRFDNRKTPQGWLPPSLLSRIHNVETWVRRLMGYELREYLLEKWGRQCAYCDATGGPLEVEHIVCRAKQGSHRLSKLTLACKPCNQAKGTQDVREFLKHDPARLALILAQAKAPLRDAAAVNATRWVLYERLKAFGLPLECGTGGRTKYNRVTRGIEKSHWADAACVGAATPEHLHITPFIVLLITAKGHGCRQICRMDRFGFPRTGPKQAKRVQGISHRSCTSLHRSDGYEYVHSRKEWAFPPTA